MLIQSSTCIDCSQTQYVKPSCRILTYDAEDAFKLLNYGQQELTLCHLVEIPKQPAPELKPVHKGEDHDSSEGNWVCWTHWSWRHSVRGRSLERAANTSCHTRNFEGACLCEEILKRQKSFCSLRLRCLISSSHLYALCITTCIVGHPHDDPDDLPTDRSRGSNFSLIFVCFNFVFLQILRKFYCLTQNLLSARNLNFLSLRLLENIFWHTLSRLTSPLSEPPTAWFQGLGVWAFWCSGKLPKINFPTDSRDSECRINFSWGL